MNVYLNYLLEASIGLCLFLIAYQLLLRRETNFKFNRAFLLIAIIASVTFPLFKFHTPDSPIPSLHFSVEQTAVHEGPAPQATGAVEMVQPTRNFREVAGIVYAGGLLLFLLIFLIRLTGIVKVFRQSSKYTYRTHHIVELKGDHTAFSFFNYIFIGKAAPLSEKEKQQIIEHESIHAKLYHSVDIVLLNVLGIVFWFNPVIRIYKKIFVQLHEFEADARAVAIHDVDEYCSLLAKVALHSAHFKLANHFSNSLTLKRIEMMRTLKHKIRSWKFVVVAAFLPVVFLVVSCQDQMETSAIVEQPLKYPSSVQQKLDELSAQFPDGAFTVLGPGKSMPALERVNDGSDAMIIKFENETYPTGPFHVVLDKDRKGENIIYVILEPRRVTSILPPKENEEVVKLPLDEKIYTAVDNPAEYPGGLNSLQTFLKNNVVYPEVAKRNGTKGKVYIKFTINKDGALADFTILRGISRELDEEALRVMKLMPAWTPAKQNGTPVNQYFILPIAFGTENQATSGIKDATGNFMIEYSKKMRGDKITFSGTVTDSNGNPLPGVSMMSAGTTKETTTDSEGKFNFETPETSGKLIASFIGFDNKTILF